MFRGYTESLGCSPSFVFHQIQNFRNPKMLFDGFNVYL